MRKYLKRKMAMCLLAASLFNKSQNSNAMVRNIQNNCQNKQTGMSQMVKIGVAAGLTAGLLSLGIVIPLIVINSKADENEVEKKMLQENKNRLQNLFNKQAEKCKIENIQKIKKYWDALNGIAKENFDDIWSGIYNYHSKGNTKVTFSNARMIIDNAVAGVAVSNNNERNHMDAWKDQYKYFYFGFFKNIFNGKYQVKELKILSDNSKIIFKFLTTADSTINISFESEDYGLEGKSPYKNDICPETGWQFLRINYNISSLDLRFTDIERDFGLEF